MREKQPPDWLTNIAPIAASIAALFHPQVEVVVHCLKRDRIVGIWNAYSGRKVGDPALLADLRDSEPTNDVWPAYEKRMPNGRRLVSISALLRDDKRRAVGLMCINFDRGQIDEAIDLLGRIAMPVGCRPPELFSRDWREQIGIVVDEECRRMGVRVEALSQAQRLEILHALNVRGLFETRAAAQHVADAFGVSRARVYQLLKEASKLNGRNFSNDKTKQKSRERSLT